MDWPYSTQTARCNRKKCNEQEHSGYKERGRPRTTW